jgi:hypothetical protein
VEPSVQSDGPPLVLAAYSHRHGIPSGQSINQLVCLIFLSSRLNSRTVLLFFIAAGMPFQVLITRCVKKCFLTSVRADVRNFNHGKSPGYRTIRLKFIGIGMNAVPKN